MKIIGKNTHQKHLLILLALCIITLIPFLGLIDYHTKGEPREAVVAQSMVEQGTWILPVNAGGDIAYKPPFYHWCVAVLSLPFGEVTEFTSRLASAVWAIAMVVMFYLFYSKRSTSYQAFVASLVVLTSFEVHRAAMNSRVDMVLTALSVMSILKLYIWWENGMKGVPFWAVLFMSGAVLTKGPVGFLLPCASCGLFLLFNGVNFFKAFWKMGYVAALSCILPALWYYLAYQQGGEEFLALVKEENIDRFTGDMSYRSHERPVSYNFVTLIAGYIPWTILLVISLFFLPYRSLNKYTGGYFDKLKNWFIGLERVNMYTLITIVIYFVFYSIPKSKRSVYILPLYPFIAFFVARFFIWLKDRSNKPFNIFGWILTAVSSIVFALLLFIRFVYIDPELYFKEKTAHMIGIYIDALNGISWIILPLITLLALIGSIFVFVRERNNKMFNPIYLVAGIVVSLQLFLDGALQPAILNTKSIKDFAIQVEQIVPEGNIYGYINDRLMRFYIVNFYTHDRVKRFQIENPEEGYVLIGDESLIKDFIPEYGDTFELEPVIKTRHADSDISEFVTLYKFKKK